MRKSTEEALRWFLRKELNTHIFMVVSRNADINQPMHSPPDELSRLEKMLRKLEEEEVDNS